MKLPGFVVRMSQKFQQPLEKSHERISRKDSNQEKFEKKKQRELWNENPAWVDKPNEIKKSETTMSRKVSNQEIAEEKNQVKLWNENPTWKDKPYDIKVTSEKGLNHVKIVMKLGFPPEDVFDLFATLEVMKGVFRPLNRSRKILKTEGDKQIVEVKQEVPLKGWWGWTKGTFPMTLIAHEDRKHLIAKYKKEKMMFMEKYEESLKVEPLLIDERMCEPIKPKTRQEYRKCSKGRGRTASQVTIDQYFKPTLLLNVPPFSSYIRKITIKETKYVLYVLESFVMLMRDDSEFETVDPVTGVHKVRRYSETRFTR